MKKYILLKSKWREKWNEKHLAKSKRNQEKKTKGTKNLWETQKTNSKRQN